MVLEKEWRLQTDVGYLPHVEQKVENALLFLTNIP